MRAIRRVCAVALVSGLTVLGVGAGLGPAAAEPIEHEHFHEVTSEVVEGFCGDLTVRVDGVVDGMFLGNFRGSDGLFYGMATVRSTVSFTNVANGKTLTTTASVVDKDLRVTDNGDGTLTVLVMITGGERWVGPDGKLLFNEPGQIRFELLVDHGGTPTDPSDDEIIAVSGLVKGSTGRNDTQGLDFCDDMIQVIR